MKLEALVLCFLLLVSFFLNVIQDGDLFLKVPLDVRALRFSNVFNRVLLSLHLADLFTLEHDFLSELLNLVLELSDGGVETERLLLLQAHLTVLLAHD